MDLQVLLRDSVRSALSPKKKRREGKRERKRGTRNGF
jgi:hypothetical protein